jgi:hypothetical protein
VGPQDTRLERGIRLVEAVDGNRQVQLGSFVAAERHNAAAVDVLVEPQRHNEVAVAEDSQLVSRLDSLGGTDQDFQPTVGTTRGYPHPVNKLADKEHRLRVCFHRGQDLQRPESKPEDTVLMVCCYFARSIPLV